MKKHWVLLAMPPLQNVGTVDWSWCVGLKTQRPLGSALYTKAEHQTKANKPATQQKQQTHNSQKTTNPQNQQIHRPTKNQQQPETSKHKSKIHTKASKHTKNNKHTTKTTSTQNQQTQKQNTHQSLVLDTAAFDVVFLSLERIFLSFLASQSMELQKTRKAFGSPSTPGQNNFHYSEPSKQFYYSESRLLMDYPFEKMIGGMFLNKV